jgi:hypothetical protein
MKEIAPRKKTYIVAGIGAALVFAQLLGVEIPVFIWELLGISGAVAIRLAISKAEK